MIATILSFVGLVLAVVVLGLAIVATMAGALVTVFATPGDRLIEIEPRPAGIGAAFLGILIFIAALDFIIRLVGVA